MQNCQYCLGTGRDPNSGPITGYKPCPVCDGRIERQTNGSPLKPCPFCQGSGRDPNTGLVTGYKPCPVCKGWGTITENKRNLSLRVEETDYHTRNSKYFQDTKEIDKRSVFVVHGRDLKARDALFQFLRSIGLKPIEWSQAVAATGKATPYVGEIIEKGLSMSQAVVVLMTPDDEGRLLERLHSPRDSEFEKKLTPQARLNVIFEAGMAMGMAPNRTLLVELGNLRPFSDIGGRHIIRLDNSPEKRKELANRLENAECSIDLSGSDWLKCGDFTI